MEDLFSAVEDNLFVVFDGIRAKKRLKHDLPHKLLFVRKLHFDFLIQLAWDEVGRCLIFLNGFLVLLDGLVDDVLS